MSLTRRTALAAGIAALASPASFTPACAAPGYDPPGSLVDAARKEGRVVMYTASFTEVEQQTAAEFNKRFPFVQVEVIRASGGQLITRVKAEIAAGKLIADVVDHSDRGLMVPLEDSFIDYAPPNAGDYLPASQFSKRFWPRISPIWCIAYNSELTKTPPKGWMDLTKAETYAPGIIGQVIAPSGGTTWVRVMFERQKFGDDYWVKQAATKPTLYPSSAPTTDAVIRGEVSIAPIIRNVVFPKQKDGAPVELVFPVEAAPVCPYAAGIPKSSVRQNAAKLFLDWCLSTDGQAFTMTEQGNFTSLKMPPVKLAGFDPAVNKIWLPEEKPFNELRDPWIADWNRIYGYRQ